MINPIRHILLLTVLLASFGCDRGTSPTSAEESGAFNICIGDLYLKVPNEEARIFRAGWTPLERYESASISATSFGPLPREDFLVSSPDGRVLRGFFYLSSMGMRENAAVQKNSAVPPGYEPVGEFLGAPAGIRVSGQPIPADPELGRLMTMQVVVSDRVSIMVRFQSGVTSLEDVPRFLAGLEETLVRWSSGQVLAEPNGSLDCPHLSTR
jgi:hypothetical protein